jgi:hypothetical protein
VFGADMSAIDQSRPETSVFLREQAGKNAAFSAETLT